MANRKLKSSLKKFDKSKENRQILISGELGITLGGRRIVEVPNRRGFVYVRLKGNTSELIQAFNATVSPVYDMPVFVTRSVGIYKVVGRNIDRYPNQFSNAPFLPKHGAQHSFNHDIGVGGDVVWVYSQQFMPLLSYPSGTSGGMTLSVEPHFYEWNGEWKFAQTTGTPDYTPYLPTITGSARMVLSYIDPSDNSIQLVPGTPFDNAITGSAQIAQYIPDIPREIGIPLAAVRLTTGTTTIGWNAIYDLRDFFTVGKPSGSVGGAGGGGLGFVGWDEGVFLATGTVLNVTGAGATLSVSGTVFNLDVPGGGGGASGLGVVAWDSGVYKATGTILDFGRNLSASASGTVVTVHALPSWYDVKHYGAVGDGVTDDTAAISRAVSAVNGSTGSVLYFPAGQYLTSGGFTISTPCTVLGDGMGNINGQGAISEVQCNSSTAVLFTTSNYVCSFRNIALKNVAGSTPSAGAAISVQGSYIANKVDFDSVSAYGFYINFDIQVGAMWTANNIYSISPVLYGLKIRNTVNNDAGDWSITNSNFNTDLYDPDAAIRIESSSAGKIVNCKINCDVAGSQFFEHGIDVVFASSLGILLISNCSIENLRGHGIKFSGANSFHSIVINGCQFGLSWASGNNTGNGINLNGTFTDIAISNNVFSGGATPYAISLTNCDNIKLVANVNNNMGGLITHSNCTNLVVVEPSTSTPQDVSSAGSAGTTAGGYSNADHVHKGVHSVNGQYGDATVGIVAWDEGIPLGTGTVFNFVGAGVQATVSGSVVRVDVSGTSAGSDCVTTYQRVEQPVPVSSITGTLWRVPDTHYASGSLGVYYNGLMQLKGRDYEELIWSSGTYHLLFTPSTGSIHMVSYGVPCSAQPYATGTGNQFALSDSDSVLLLDSDNVQLLDSNG